MVITSQQQLVVSCDVTARLPATNIHHRYPPSPTTISCLPSLLRLYTTCLCYTLTVNTNKYPVSGLEEALFNTYLLEDASHLLVALLVIFLCVWGFTTSLTLTLACLSSIIGDTTLLLEPLDLETKVFEDFTIGRRALLRLCEIVVPMQ